MTEAFGIRNLSAAELDRRISALSAVLMDCVEGGASVSFMAPLTPERADAFWRGIQDRVAAGAIGLLAAELSTGEIVGTVQLVKAQPENQPHRADVAKLLVRRSVRRQGIGRALMSAAEELARREGKSLLVLDTADHGAERLYRELGWVEVGRVPGYALFPDGRPCDTTIFFKQLASSGGDSNSDPRS